MQYHAPKKLVFKNTISLQIKLFRFTGNDKEHFQKKQNYSPTMRQTSTFYRRMTIQKGPEFLSKQPKLALDFDPHIKFIMAGDVIILLRFTLRPLIWGSAI
jgi:hypothetical protein